jgi:hypothetical protein
VAIYIAAGLVLTIAIVLLVRKLRGGDMELMTGAIIADDRDPHKQRPIRNAVVTVESGVSAGKSVSESSGLFRLKLQPPVAKGDPIFLRVQHPDYHPLEITAPAEQRLHVLRLKPSAPTQPENPSERTVRISNIRVRYATRITTTSTVGAAVRTFDIVNTGNVPCQGKPPCSPDGKWKANIDSLALDTGADDKHFRNVRVSCLAGPCPFTAIESDQFSRGGRKIGVSVRNWSDRVTYLLEAEVAQTGASEMIRHTYPPTFGRSMNFTLPAGATGTSIEADVDGASIVFPLGPELKLSWATCGVENGAEGTRLYRCELKPGHIFNGQPATPVAH